MADNNQQSSPVLRDIKTAALRLDLHAPRLNLMEVFFRGYWGLGYDTGYRPYDRYSTSIKLKVNIVRVTLVRSTVATSSQVHAIPRK